MKGLKRRSCDFQTMSARDSDVLSAWAELGIGNGVVIMATGG